MEKWKCLALFKKITFLSLYKITGLDSIQIALTMHSWLVWDYLHANLYATKWECNSALHPIRELERHALSQYHSREMPVIFPMRDKEEEDIVYQALSTISLMKKAVYKTTSYPRSKRHAI